MACPFPMSPLSAAIPLAAWVQTHGRYPIDLECVTRNNLPHWGTIYKLFPGSSFSARISVALGLPGAFASNIKLRECLGTGCAVRFYTTPAVRLCPRCHALTTRDESAYEIPALSRAQLEQFGIGLADWDVGVMV